MADAPKLDWMYAGPAGHVNPEEYLTGRAVDKTFEQFKLGGAEPIGLDLPPPTLPREKSSVPRTQVDVARKVQEDPLLSIRKKEEERKAALREQMLIQQRLNSHNKLQSKPKEIKVKKGRKSSSEDSSDESDLDSKLALKLKRLKESDVSESLDQQILKKLKRLKERRDSSSSTSSSDSNLKNQHRKNDKSHRLPNDRQSTKYTSYQADRYRDDRSRHHQSTSSRKQKRSRSPKSDRRRSRSASRERKHINGPQLPRRQVPTVKRNTGMKLSEEELEKRRKEMMQSAVVREHERKVKVDQYRKEVADEAGQLNADRPKEAEFVKRQLASVTSNTTVEARIKANVFNIQRSGNSMNSNFARR